MYLKYNLKVQYTTLYKSVTKHHNCKVIKIFFKEGPYEFMLDVIENKIIITGILEGGIIYKHGKFNLINS